MARERGFVARCARSPSRCHRISPVSDIGVTLPWLLPGTALAFAASLLASNRVSRWLGVRRSVAWIGLFSLGVILSSTLSPQDPPFGIPPGAVRTCDATRTWIAPLSEVLRGSDATLNILLFIPLGWAIGTAPWSARKAVVVLGVSALPFAIEVVQLLVTVIRRGCESADVVDNLTGLAVGLLAGVVTTRLVPALRRSGPQTG